MIAANEFCVRGGETLYLTEHSSGDSKFIIMLLVDVKFVYDCQRIYGPICQVASFDAKFVLVA